MSTNIRAALDAAEQHATTEVWAGHPLAIILEALIKQTRAVLASKPVGEGPILQRTANKPPCEECRYDHCAADTPFGRFLISWKSWKQFDSPTVDETPWGDWYGAFNSVGAAKAACQREMDERLARWGCPAALAAAYIDPEGEDADRQLLEVFCSQLGRGLEVDPETLLRGIRGVRAFRFTSCSSHLTPAEVQRIVEALDFCIGDSDHRANSGNHHRLRQRLKRLIATFPAPSDSGTPRPATPPAPLPLDYIDPDQQGDDRELLRTFYQACNAEGGTADEIHLRGLKAVLAAHPANPAAPETALAAKLISESKPIAPEMALAPEARWDLYESPAPLPRAGEVQP